MVNRGGSDGSDENLVWLLVFATRLPLTSLCLPRPPVLAPLRASLPSRSATGVLVRKARLSIALVLVMTVAMLVLGGRVIRRGVVCPLAQSIRHTLLVRVTNGRNPEFPTQPLGRLAEHHLHPSRSEKVVVPVINEIARRLAVLELHFFLNGHGGDETREETHARHERDRVGSNTLRGRERPRLFHVGQEPFPVLLGHVV